MERDALEKMLRRVRAGRLSVRQALDELATFPIADLGFATVDTHRALRRGFPEVVYGPGKTAEQIAAIVRSIDACGQTALVTRVDPEIAREVIERQPELRYLELPRALVLERRRRRGGRPGVVVVTAGTSDLPVAEEAALTAELMGERVERIRDVGVAGLHRLTRHRATLAAARVIVAVAGMEGALPSVVAGLTDCPVIGVPTSTGYGAGAGGQAALLAMLNSCASGLTVVNIDNGFGAGFAASLINRRSKIKRKNTPTRHTRKNNTP
ncbi:MAG TPA: nickel pincer cofactor biosynthesis protein LarB [Candidatus Polarisedimenticolaceae bacterium]|nr:nickel pincer cofactor biosynthesis protein LarB [Candidatus Polarisedimenticolaceae bacterium]